MSQPPAQVTCVSRSPGHAFSKQPVERIRLLDGLGVEGDAHAGTTMRHRSRTAGFTERPNLRQIHLIEAELFDDLASLGHLVSPGNLGENVTTAGLDLLTLPTGTILRIGVSAEVRVTGLRNPCRQIDRFQAGLMKKVLTRDVNGKPAFRSGVMAVVIGPGLVERGDEISVVLPQPPYVALTPV